jgi:hypothetical protein
MDTDSIGSSFANEVVDHILENDLKDVSKEDFLRAFPNKKFFKDESKVSVTENERNIEIPDSNDMMKHTIAEALFPKIRSKTLA